MASKHELQNGLNIRGKNQYADFKNFAALMLLNLSEAEFESSQKGRIGCVNNLKEFDLKQDQFHFSSGMTLHDLDINSR